MKYTRYFLIAAALVGGFSAQALDVTVAEPGSLFSQVENPATETSLTVSGNIDATDFIFIADNMPKLTTLNLQNAVIEDYSGKVLSTGVAKTADNTLPPFALFGTNVSIVVLPSTITSIGDYALASTQLSSIDIPASVTTLGDGVFASTALQRFVLPETVKTIGSGLFKDCKQLEEIALNQNVTVLPPNTFAGCTALKYITAPAVVEIGQSALSYCTSLVNYPFNESLKAIGDKAFYNSGIISLNLTDEKKLEGIGNYAFANCRQLTEAFLPEQLTNIGAGLFMGDAALTDISVSSKLTAIPDYTYSGVAALDTAAANKAIPLGVTSIGDFALNGWQTIEVYRLPDNLESLGDYAMAGWKALRELHAEGLTEVPQTGEDVWEGVDKQEVILYITYDYTDLFKAADQWNEFKLDNSTSVDDIVADATASAIDYCVIDGKLIVSSRGSEIVSTTVFDLSGRRRFSKTGAEHTVAVNIADWTPGVYGVQVVLADGVSEALKIRL